MPVDRDWDAFFMEHAHLAATMTTCLRRGVGAAIVMDRHVVSGGFNGNTPKALHCNEGGCTRCGAVGSGRPSTGTDLHVCVCVHAEQNAIAWCARYGVRIEGATMYVTTKPCLDCIKLAAVAGIVEVLYDQEYPVEYDVPPTIQMRAWRGPVRAMGLP